MLPMTGGCHYDEGCERFLRGCGTCPQLGSNAADDVSSAILGRSRAAVKQIRAGRLHFVTPSRWLAAEARRSPVCGAFEVSVIPNSLDLELYKPLDRAAVRAQLGLPQEAPIALFFAEALGKRRKGMGLLMQALEGLRDLRDSLTLVSVGKAEVPVPAGLTCRRFGEIHDEALLARIYAAADMLLLPSMQDNLPNTMIEAMACGTPVIGFAIGGLPDLIRDRENGLLVAPGDADGFGRAVRRLAGARGEAADMGRRARELVARECSPVVQAGRYRDLFASMVRAT
jgi:glycosyltransferase involved in cell wall biosynthesis